MLPTFDTRKLLRRSSLTRQTVTLLAWLEGATHTLRINDARMTFYRHARGAVQAATATREADGWSLSSWTLRSVPHVPPVARELPKPQPLVNRATV